MHVQLTFAGDITEISALLSQLQTAEAIASAKPAQAAVEPKPKGRKPKDTEPNPTPAPAAVEAAPVKAPPPVVEKAPETTAAIPTDAEVQAALVAVNDKHGIEKAIECLTKFNVKRGRELTDEQKAPFVALCKQVLG